MWPSILENIKLNINGIVDKFITSDKEKSELKDQLSTIVLSNLNQVYDDQKTLILAEAQGSSLQRNWRPILMLGFGFIVIYQYFLQPLFSSSLGLVAVPLDTKFWDLLQLGIGGYVMGRSAEKITDSITKNVDLTFLKKKDRKDEMK